MTIKKSLRKTYGAKWKDFGKLLVNVKETSPKVPFTLYK